MDYTVYYKTMRADKKYYCGHYKTLELALNAVKYLSNKLINGRRLGFVIEKS